MWGPHDSNTCNSVTIQFCSRYSSYSMAFSSSLSRFHHLLLITTCPISHAIMGNFIYSLATFYISDSQPIKTLYKNKIIVLFVVYILKIGCFSQMEEILLTVYTVPPTASKNLITILHHSMTKKSVMDLNSVLKSIFPPFTGSLSSRHLLSYKYANCLINNAPWLFFNSNPSQQDSFSLANLNYLLVFSILANGITMDLVYLQTGDTGINFPELLGQKSTIKQMTVKDRRKGTQIYILIILLEVYSRKTHKKC